MVNKSILVAAFCVLASGANAAEPRNVPWFIMHNHERIALARHCDPMLLRSVAEIECHNARKAVEIMEQADRQLALTKSEFNNPGSIHSPQYWDRWPLARANQLRECARPSSALIPDRLSCDAARISAGMPAR